MPPTTYSNPDLEDPTMATMTNDDRIAATPRPAERRLTTETKPATTTTVFYA